MRTDRAIPALAAVLAAISFLSVGPAPARAQAMAPARGYAPSWGGYAPGGGWSYYNQPGWSGYAPGTAPAPANPGAAWRGYAPATAWSGYAPGAAWSGYAPGAAVPGGGVATGVVAGRAPAVGGRSRPATSRFEPTTYREFGTGRNLFLHKPWLPNQP